MSISLYHGTRYEFSEFSDAAPGTREDSSTNSALGLWFATTSDWLSGFGNRVIEAEVDVGVSYAMSVRELRQKTTEFESKDNCAASDASGLECDGHLDVARECWREARANLLAKGYDSVAIVESGGDIQMYVVLKAESVLSFRDLVPLPPIAPGMR